MTAQEAHERFIRIAREALVRDAVAEAEHLARLRPRRRVRVAWGASRRSAGPRDAEASEVVTADDDVM